MGIFSSKGCIIPMYHQEITPPWWSLSSRMIRNIVAAPIVMLLFILLSNYRGKDESHAGSTSREGASCDSSSDDGVDDSTLHQETELCGSGEDQDPKEPDIMPGIDKSDTEKLHPNQNSLENSEAKSPENGEAENGEAKSPENGEAKSPENGEAKSPENGEAKSPENGEAKSPENGEAKSPENGEAKFLKNGKAEFLMNPEELWKSFLKDAEKTESGFMDTKVTDRKQTFKKVVVEVQEDRFVENLKRTRTMMLEYYKKSVRRRLPPVPAVYSAAYQKRNKDNFSSKRKAHSSKRDYSSQYSSDKEPYSPGKNHYSSQYHSSNRKAYPSNQDYSPRSSYDQELYSSDQESRPSSQYLSTQGRYSLQQGPSASAQDSEQHSSNQEQRFSPRRVSSSSDDTSYDQTVDRHKTPDKVMKRDSNTKSYVPSSNQDKEDCFDVLREWLMWPFILVFGSAVAYGTFCYFRWLVSWYLPGIKEVDPNTGGENGEGGENGDGGTNDDVGNEAHEGETDVEADGNVTGADAETDADATTDAGANAGANAGAEGTTDAAADAGAATDAGAEAGAEGTTDAAADAGAATDAGAEAGAEGTTDAAADAGAATDAGTEAGAEAGADAAAQEALEAAAEQLAAVQAAAQTAADDAADQLAATVLELEVAQAAEEVAGNQQAAAEAATEAAQKTAAEHAEQLAAIELAGDTATEAADEELLAMRTAAEQTAQLVEDLNEQLETANQAIQAATQRAEAAVAGQIEAAQAAADADALVEAAIEAEATAMAAAEMGDASAIMEAAGAISDLAAKMVEQIADCTLLMAKVTSWVGYRTCKRYMRLRADLRWQHDGKEFGWGNTLREHPKLYPYYKHRDYFAPKIEDSGIIKENPLFITALVKNGGTGKFRYGTKDSHFDKVGSIRRSLYIPDGTRVHILCQEERVTLQRCIKAHKLLLSRKLTASWNNRYIYNGTPINTGDVTLSKGMIVTLVNFGKDEPEKPEQEKKCKSSGNAFWHGCKAVGRYAVEIFKPARSFFDNWEFTRSTCCLGLADRYWKVAVIDKQGIISSTLHVVDEKDLKHVGFDNIEKARSRGDNWQQFELLGNINKCNLIDLQWGTTPKKEGDKKGPHSISESDVPGYGELYGHCAGDTLGESEWDFRQRWLNIKGGKYFKGYKCNYCWMVGEYEDCKYSEKELSAVKDMKKWNEKRKDMESVVREQALS